MKKFHTTKSESKIETQVSFSSKKKPLTHQTPSIVTNAFGHMSPNPPLQFKNHNVLQPITHKTGAQYSAYKTVSTPIIGDDKLGKREKENDKKQRKLSTKRSKEGFKITEKKKMTQKVRQLQNKFVKMSQDAKNTKRNSELKGLVTQFRAEDLIVKTEPIKFNFKSKKVNSTYYISEILNGYSANNNPVSRLAKAHLNTSLQLLNFTKRVSKPTFCKPVRKLNKQNRKTIVFDLDETLVHCNDSLDKPSDIVLSIVFPSGQSTKAGINIRPYARECLQELSQHYELIVFTASHACYANVVIDYLDPQNKLISHRFYRDSCFHSPQGMHIKDLRVIDRSLRDILLVDNKAAYSYCFQIENGVPIVPFYDCKEDTELKSLTQYLKVLSCSRDLRREHCRVLKTDRYSGYSDPNDLIAGLYSDYLL